MRLSEARQEGRKAAVRLKGKGARPCEASEAWRTWAGC